MRKDNIPEYLKEQHRPDRDQLSQGEASDVHLEYCVGKDPKTQERKAGKELQRQGIPADVLVKPDSIRKVPQEIVVTEWNQ